MGILPSWSHISIIVNEFNEKKLDSNNTRMLPAKSWKQHPTKTVGLQLLIFHLSNRPSKTWWYCCWSKDELISDVLRTDIHRHTGVGWPAKIYIYQLCADIGYYIEDLLKWWPQGMDSEREKERRIHAVILDDDVSKNRMKNEPEYFEVENSSTLINHLVSMKKRYYRE